VKPITLDEKWFVFGLYFEEHGNMPEVFLEDEQGKPLDLMSESQL